MLKKNIAAIEVFGTGVEESAGENMARDQVCVDSSPKYVKEKLLTYPWLVFT